MSQKVNLVAAKLKVIVKLSQPHLLRKGSSGRKFQFSEIAVSKTGNSRDETRKGSAKLTENSRSS